MKGRDGGMLVEGKAVKHRWSEYFDELFNVDYGVQVSVVVIGGDKRMSVFGRLNDREVKSYEVDERMSKMATVASHETIIRRWSLTLLSLSLLVRSSGGWIFRRIEQQAMLTIW